MISPILIGKLFVNTNRQETLNCRLPTVRNGIQNKRKKLNPGMILLLLP